MEALRLPIELVPGTTPPLFRWRQVVETVNGRKVVDNEGQMPPSVEHAVVELVGIAKRLMLENAGLAGEIAGLRANEVASAGAKAAVPIKKAKG